MKSIFNKSLLLASTVISVGVSAPAFAQDAASDGDIVVTARRTEEKLQDVPISITVFNQAQLTNRNIVSAGELATYTPSLSTNPRFGSESTSFAIRGFTQEGPTSPSVGVYFADVVAPRANGGTTAGNGAGVGSMFDLQNVQVLKGPQGTLQGRNTTGGAVLLVPQKPTNEFGGYVQGSVGNYDMRRAQGVINVPVGDAVRLRLGVDHQTRDGYLNNVSGIGPKDFGDVDYTALRFSASVDLASNLENYTIISSGKSDTNGFYPKVFNQDNRNRDPYAGLRAAQIAATAGDYYDIANGNPTAFQKINQWQVINTTTWSVADNLTFKNIISYAEFQQSQSSNIYGENGFQNGTTNPYYAINIVPVPGSHNASESTFTEEFQVQGDLLEGRFNYQGGLYYEKSDPLGGLQRTRSANGLACTSVVNLQCSNPQQLVGYPAGFIQQSQSQYEYEDLGLYAQGTYKFTDKLSLTAGLRYTEDTSIGDGQVLKISFPTANNPSYSCSQPPQNVIGGTSAQIQANNALCNYHLEEESSKPTWLVDLDYKPTDDVLLYVKYARGYRAGGVNVSSFGLEQWKPEKLDLYELGAKTSFRGAMPGYINAAAFYNDFSSQQIATNTVSCGNVAGIPNFTAIFPACAGIPAINYPSPAQGIGNGGKSSIWGLELDGSISPFKGFTIDAAYAYLQTKLETFTLPAIPYGFARLDPAAIVGGSLGLSPKNKYSVTATYVLPLEDSIGKVSLAATYSAQSKQIGTTSSVGLRQELPPQSQLNLNANWNSVLGSPVDVGVFGTNVLEEEFDVYRTGSSFGYDAAILNAPAFYGVNVKYHFGG